MGRGLPPLRYFFSQGCLIFPLKKLLGIADLGAWIDVNVYRPIPYWAFVRFAKQLKEDAIDIEVIAAEADMVDGYLRPYGILLFSFEGRVFDTLFLARKLK